MTRFPFPVIINGRAGTVHEDLQITYPKCDACGGDGWYVDHAPECYDSGDCSCTGVQVQCDRCVA